MNHVLRAATLADRPRLKELIELSARTLGIPDYRPDQIEAALRGAFGVDSTLIEDGTYFVAELRAAEAGLPAGGFVGCGGWSRRRTLFGGDSHARRNPEPLDPATDAARIRAFFVHPGYVRRGVGRALLELCENAARAAGFTRFELMGTLPGVRLYEALGYRAGSMIHYPLEEGVSIEFVPMSKESGS